MSTTTTRRAGMVARSEPPLAATSWRASSALKLVLSLTRTDVVPGAGLWPPGSVGGLLLLPAPPDGSATPWAVELPATLWAAPAAPSTSAPPRNTTTGTSFHSAFLVVCRGYGYTSPGCGPVVVGEWQIIGILHLAIDKLYPYN